MHFTTIRVLSIIKDFEYSLEFFNHLIEIDPFRYENMDTYGSIFKGATKSPAGTAGHDTVNGWRPTIHNVNRGSTTRDPVGGYSGNTVVTTALGNFFRMRSEILLHVQLASSLSVERRELPRICVFQVTTSACGRSTAMTRGIKNRATKV